MHLIFSFLEFQEKGRQNDTSLHISKVSNENFHCFIVQFGVKSCGGQSM